MEGLELFAPKGRRHWRRIKRLYRRAFPRCERKPWIMISQMQNKGDVDVWYFQSGGEFLGLAITACDEKTVLLDYFAVSKKLRGRGYGTKMLKALIAQYSGKTLILEIEKPYPNGKDYLNKQKRKSFYLNAGLIPLMVSIRLFGVDMELMGTAAGIDYAAYRSFYFNKFGKYAPISLFEKNITKIE